MAYASLRRSRPTLNRRGLGAPPPGYVAQQVASAAQTAQEAAKLVPQVLHVAGEVGSAIGSGASAVGSAVSSAAGAAAPVLAVAAPLVIVAGMFYALFGQRQHEFTDAERNAMLGAYGLARDANGNPVPSGVLAVNESAWPRVPTQAEQAMTDANQRALFAEMILDGQTIGDIALGATAAQARGEYVKEGLRFAVGGPGTTEDKLAAVRMLTPALQIVWQHDYFLPMLQAQLANDVATLGAAAVAGTPLAHYVAIQQRQAEADAAVAAMNAAQPASDPPLVVAGFTSSQAVPFALVAAALLFLL